MEFPTDVEVDPSGRRYGASGEVHIHEREARVIRADVAALEDVSEFTAGAAHGSDTVAQVAAAAAHPEALHRIVIPFGWHNPSIVKMVYDELSARGVDPLAHMEVIRMPVDTDYMERNDVVALHVDVLLAFPADAEEELRSGTWATVRRVRKRGGEVRVRALGPNVRADAEAGEEGSDAFG